LVPLTRRDVIYTVQLDNTPAYYRDTQRLDSAFQHTTARDCTLTDCRPVELLARSSRLPMC